MLYILFAGLESVPSAKETALLEALLPFLTGERVERFNITRSTLKRALLNQQWFDYTYVLAPSLYEAQDAFVQALNLLDNCEELRFLVSRDDALLLASGNRVYRIPKAGIVRFQGTTSLTQAARLIDLTLAELAYIEDLKLPPVDFGDIFKSDSLVSGRRKIKAESVEVEFVFGDITRQVHLSMADYRLSVYAESVNYEETRADFQFVNYGRALPVLTSCILWDWLLQNAVKALVRLDNAKDARIEAGSPVTYSAVLD